MDTLSIHKDDNSKGFIYSRIFAGERIGNRELLKELVSKDLEVRTVSPFWFYDWGILEQLIYSNFWYETYTVMFCERYGFKRE